MKGQIAACVLLLSLAHGVWSKCPEVCTLEYAPVCGSDGRTYSNECFLEVVSCKGDGTLTKVHDGPCKEPRARRDVDDGCPKYAHLNICTLEYAPVCASNGKTYPNLCGMCAYMYQQQKEGHNLVLTVEYRGVCKTESDECPENPSGICTADYSPVCGSDGKTYSNKCMYCYAKKQKEQNEEELSLVHNGECSAAAAMSADHVTCLEHYNTGICTREYSPICGSDGQTYDNTCVFCFETHEKAMNGEEVTVDHFGECSEIERRAVDDVVCLERYNTGACTREYFPVCGSDGKTYGNKCTFCFAKNQKQQNGEELSVDHFGRCPVVQRRAVDEIECKERYNTGACTREYFPICGSDGKMYGNKCTFCFAKHQKQQNGEELTVDHIGVC